MAASRPAPTYWPDFSARTGLWCVRDAFGPVDGFETIPCRREAEQHALDLIAAAEADRAALDDHEAQILAEAA